MTRCVAGLAAVVLACGGDRSARGSERADGGTVQTPATGHLAGVTVVTAGDKFTCALTDEGKALCWGANAAGQLGTGSTVETTPTPQVVGATVSFTDLSAGREHACALSADGGAHCWGHDPNGALGRAATLARVPTSVVTSARFVRISAGDQRTCAVTKEGAAHCWGRFSRPSTDPAGRGGPEVVSLETTQRFRSLAAGLTHACGITNDARLYCWGSNSIGQLGAGGPTSARWAPPQLVSLGDEVTQVSVSSNGTCAVTRSGAAYCWGSNAFGQLGNGAWTERYAANATPTRVVGDHSWRQVSTGGGFTCGLTADGDAYCWGMNDASRRLLGSGAAPDRCGSPSPARECSTRPIPVAGGIRFRALATGGSHSCGIATDRRVYCWGMNESGQLGNGATRASVEPVPVVAAGGSPPRRPASAGPAGRLVLRPVNPPIVPGGEPRAPTEGGQIVITLHGAVGEAVITDPLGRRLGIEPATGNDFKEVPEASYDSSGLGTLRDDSIVDEDPPWKEIYFNAPVDGEYAVTVIGTRAGTYTLSIGGYDTRRRSSSFTPKNVPISPGERHQYRFRFARADAGERGLDGRRVHPPNR